MVSEERALVELLTNLSKQGMWFMKTDGKITSPRRTSRGSGRRVIGWSRK